MGGASNRWGSKCSGNSCQEILDIERFWKELFRFDHDPLAGQVAESVARHEEDAKFFLHREHLLHKVVSVDPGVLVDAGEYFKTWRRKKQICQQ